MKVRVYLCLCMIVTNVLVKAADLSSHEINSRPENRKEPFNINEIVSLVSHHPIVEDDIITIRDENYEAYFGEDGVILDVKTRENGSETVVISMSGQPSISNGKVVYRTERGEIVFSGTKKGLSYVQRTHASSNSPIMEYSYTISGEDTVILAEWPEQGEFIIDTSIILSPMPYNQTYPTIAFDGTNYFVVWMDRRNGAPDIYGARVDQSGNVLDLSGIAIAIGDNWQCYPSIAFDGSNYLVVWHDHTATGADVTDVYGTLVSPSGEVLSDGVLISGASYEQEYPSVAFGGASYLVVWQDTRNGLDGDIYGARVDLECNVLDPGGIAISALLNSQTSPSVAFDGLNYFVVWRDGRNNPYIYDIYGARVSTSGLVIDTAGIAVSTATNSQIDPDVIFGLTNYLVVWVDGRLGTPDIYGARVNQSGTVLDQDGLAIRVQSDPQRQPSVAFDGTNYLVVWCEDVTVRCTRVDQSGIILDPSSITIGDAIWSQDQSAAFDGTNYLVVWNDDHNNGHDIIGARIDQLAAVIDTQEVVISSTANWQFNPAVAYDGTNYLVVWEDSRNPEHDIYGMLVDATGNPLDTAAFAISVASGYQQEPAVAFDGTNYLVVWTHERSGYATDIYGARVDQSGILLDPTGIPISTTPEAQNSPAISCNGTNYLVVWHDKRNQLVYPYRDVYGARVDFSGTVLDPDGIPIAAGEIEQANPDVGFGSTNYFVVWHEQWRSIRGRSVSPSGLLVGGITTISTGEEYQVRPSIAFDGLNYFVVWIDYRNDMYPDNLVYGSRVNQYGILLDPSGIAIGTWLSKKDEASVVYDGTDFFTVWHDDFYAGENDIIGAKVDTSGAVMNLYQVCVQYGDQESPALVGGSDDQLLVVYSSWTDSIGDCLARSMRIWGKFSPFVGIEERTESNTKHNPLRLQVFPNPFRTSVAVRCEITDDLYGTAANVGLELKIFDISGRLVRDFSPELGRVGDSSSVVWDGTDRDGCQLPGGVYFLEFTTGQHREIKKLLLVR